MCAKDYPKGFIFISYVFYVLIFILMATQSTIFVYYYADRCYKNYENYFVWNDTILNKYNYDNITNLTYITDIQFAYFSSDYNLYGLTGEPIEKCFLGSCYTKRDQTSKNCSETCAIYGSSCEANNQKCINVYCKKMDNGFINDSVCHIYNEIKFWSGQKMILTSYNFSFNQLKDTIFFNEM